MKPKKPLQRWYSFPNAQRYPIGFHLITYYIRHNACWTQAFEPLFHIASWGTPRRPIARPAPEGPAEGPQLRLFGSPCRSAKTSGLVVHQEILHVFEKGFQGRLPVLHETHVHQATGDTWLWVKPSKSSEHPKKPSKLDYRSTAAG